MSDNGGDNEPVIFGVLVILAVFAIGYAFGLLTLSGNCIGAY